MIHVDERLLKRLADSYIQWCDAFPEWVDAEDQILLKLISEWFPVDSTEAG